MERKVVYDVSFKLRPGRDDDIAQALARIPTYFDRSDVLRDALRQYYNLEGTRPELRVSVLSSIPERL